MTQNDWADLATPPKSQWGRYVWKFDEGTFKYRITGKPCIYHEFFNHDTKPERFIEKPDKEYFEKNCKAGQYGKQLSFVWAMPAWDYQQEDTVVLQLKKAALINDLHAFATDPDRGNPTDYDIKITREGKEKETKYKLMPVAPKPLTKEIQESIKENPVDVSVLIENWDPFELTETKKDNLPF